MKRRLLGLAAGEFVALMLFLYICFLLNLGAASIVAFIYLALILLQGSMYWLYRYRLLSKDRRPGDLGIRALKVLRMLNLVLLIGSAVCLPVFSRDAIDLIVSIVVLIFGSIEYVNYYWFRLSYGKSGFNVKLLFSTGLKSSSISKIIASLGRAL